MQVLVIVASILLAAAVGQAVRIALIHRDFRPLLFAIGLAVVVVLAIQLQDRSG